MCPPEENLSDEEKAKSKQNAPRSFDASLALSLPRCGEANYGAAGLLVAGKRFPAAFPGKDLRARFPDWPSVSARKWYKLIDIRHCNRIRVLRCDDARAPARQKKSICNVNAAAVAEDPLDAGEFWFLATPPRAFWLYVEERLELLIQFMSGLLVEGSSYSWITKQGPMKL